MDSDDRYVSTARVADALGVGVTTVKRWVDDGILPAHRTAGGHRKLLMADVLRLIREGQLPNSDVGKLAPNLREARRADVDDIHDQFSRAIARADHDEIKAILHGAYRGGIGLEQLADRVVGPVLTDIGHFWASGQWNVLREHRATQATVSALYELQGLLSVRAERDRPVAIGGAPEGDPTVVPSLLARLVLLEAGWEAINLGPDSPLEAFVHAMDEYRPRLIWICATHVDDPERFLKDYAELYRSASGRGVAVAVGGQALTQNIRSRMAYTTFGDGMTQLAAFARSLAPRPAMPRRGRPPQKS